jgi:hypothetical protein
MERLTFKISDRMILVLKRWIDVNCQKWEGEDYESYFYFGKFISWCVNETDDETDLLYRFSIFYKDDILLYKFDFDHKFDLEQAIDRLLHDVFTFCKCEKELATKESWCESCFIHRFTRDDNCSICLENEGRWVQLDHCKHFYHLECFNKFKSSRKCPLCRDTIQSHTIDPFDI